MSNVNYKIITCGSEQKEIDLVKENVPKKEYEVLEYETASDLLSHNAAIYIIRIDALDEDEKILLLSLYEEIDGCTEIRNKPGIKTQELAERLEKSDRTVQRYIATLRAAGEWIVYDTEKKGWYLECGTSQLFEVYFERGE